MEKRELLKGGGRVEERVNKIGKKKINTRRKKELIKERKIKKEVFNKSRKKGLLRIRRKKLMIGKKTLITMVQKRREKN